MEQRNLLATRDGGGEVALIDTTRRAGGGPHHSCFRVKGEMRDCVLSGRFTMAENAELRALAAAVQLPVKEMVRTALMEWKARQETSLDSGALERAEE